MGLLHDSHWQLVHRSTGVRRGGTRVPCRTRRDLGCVARRSDECCLVRRHVAALRGCLRVVGSKKRIRATRAVHLREAQQREEPSHRLGPKAFSGSVISVRRWWTSGQRSPVSPYGTQRCLHPDSSTRRAVRWAACTKRAPVPSSQRAWGRSRGKAIRTRRLSSWTPAC